MDAETGKVLKAILNDPHISDNETSNQITNTTNTTSQVPQTSTNTPDIILAAALL